MCSFFSCVSKGDGVPMYFDWELRKKCLSGELKYNPDSHTSIADYFGYKGKKEDKLNKYEYNPITQEFVIDQLNTKDDSKAIEEACRALDFSTIVPALICKKPVHPFTIHNDVTQEDIDNLKKWSSVESSVGSSVESGVWSSVESSVGSSVESGVWSSVWSSVGSSVWSSVWLSVRSSVVSSVWSSVGSSVWSSVWSSVGSSVVAYASTFFNIEYKIDMSSCIALWNRGFVASFDGKTWRLHSGTDAKIVYEWRK